MISEQDLEQRLLQLGRDVAPGPSIVHAVHRRLEDVPPPAAGRRRLRRWIVRSSIGLAAAVVIAMLLWPGGKRNGAAWAEVVEQIRSARTVRMELTFRKDPAHPENTHTAVVQMKMPDKVREEHIIPRAPTMIRNGSTMMTLDPDHKTYMIEESPRTARAAIEQFLAVASFGTTSTSGAEGAITVEGQKVELLAPKVVDRDGRKLQKYLLKVPDPGAKDTKYAWFDAQSGELAMLTSEMPGATGPYEMATIKIQINLELPDSLFSVEPPPGYTHPDSAPAAEGSAEDWIQKYRQARNRIDRYRLVVWRTDSGRLHRDGQQASSPATTAPAADRLLPVGRSMRVGDRWRADAFSPVQPRGKTWSEADLDEVWQKQDSKWITATTMMLRGAPASIHYAVRMKGQTTPLTLWAESPQATGWLLTTLGWPTDAGLDARRSARREVSRALLPSRPDRRGLVGLRVELFAGTGVRDDELSIFWLDPSKDLICVHHEWYQRPGRPWRDKPDWRPAEPLWEGETPRGRGFPLADESTDVIEFGRTPSGHWYPRRIVQRRALLVEGKRRVSPPQTMLIQLDTNGPFAEELLDWPKNVPEPRR